MPTLDEQFDTGQVLLERGDLAGAEKVYRRILLQHANHPDALNLLGVVAAQSGRAQEAVELFARAIQQEPRAAMYYCNLGEAQRALGQFEQAALAYARAAELAPGDSRAMEGLAESLSNLSVLLARGKRFDEAIAACRRAVEIKPDKIAHWINLSLVAHQAGKAQVSLDAAGRAVQLAPNSPDAHAQLGAALELNERFEDAIAEYRRAIDLPAPDTDWQCINRGVVRMRLGQTLEAARDFARAVELSPGNANAHFNHAVSLLTLGDLERGWVEHEWRPNKHALARAWTGEHFSAGDSILVLHEQGFGDMIQFIRYAPLLVERGARVIVATPPPLMSLVKSVRGVERVVALDSIWPETTWQVNLLSLPMIFKTKVGSIPGNVPYLSATREVALNDSARLRVGLCWSGNITESFDRARSIRLDLLAPLLALPDISWYALQPIANSPSRIKSVLDFTDFADTAGLIQKLDLVITIDTAVAHLAGALGKPTFTLLSFSPDWRWLRDRDDSGWYPTMKLFRQPALGDWAAVIAQVARFASRFPA